MGAGYEDGWSAKKTAVIWAGAFLLALVLGATIILTSRIITTGDTHRMDVCLHTGNTVAECQVALS